MSYSQHIRDECFVNKAFGVLLVLECAAAADFLKMQDYFEDNPIESWAHSTNYTQVVAEYGTTFQFVSMAASLAVSTHLLHLDPVVAVFLYALEALSRYQHLELQEDYALYSITTNPFRGHPTMQFKPDTGHDCSIYQIEAVGEAEWIYYIPCEHHFHKYCLAMWLEQHNTCPLCRRILVQRPPEHEIWETWSDDGSNRTMEAFSDPGRTAVQATTDRHHPRERRRAASTGYQDVANVRTETAAAANRYVQFLRDHGDAVMDFINGDAGSEGLSD